MVVAFFFCHPVTEHSSDQLASCVRVHFFLMGSEIFLLVILLFFFFLEKGYPKTPWNL